MDRGAAAHPLSWLLALVAGALMLSALSLPRQPYLGLMMREDRVAAVVPSGMIFVPSDGGVSHDPREHTSWAGCVNGANTLLRAALELSGSYAD